MKIAFITSYAPGKCGIATFASDLITNISSSTANGFEPFVIAMQSDARLKYANPVRLKIRRDIPNDYVLAANYINFSNINALSVQHEFGLFGGQAGSYLNILLRELKKPVITTLHTVLEHPPREYFDSLTNLARDSETLIVMNRHGIKMLRDIYCVPPSKIRLIPHGIPDFPFVNTSPYKRMLSMSARKTILTFGLLGRNKGIEVMLRALPAIVKVYPSTLYIVLGATHPEVLRREGQSYKQELEKIVADLGLQQNVLFCNKFVDEYLLEKFLCAADIYVTPYKNKEQLTSGTLALAIAAGKAVVSTPYRAAQELLAQGRGRLVPFGDSHQMAKAITKILSDSSAFNKMRKRAYDYGRSMTWPGVAQAYFRLFKAHTSSIQVPLKPTIQSREWKTPAYASLPAYQSAS